MKRKYNRAYVLVLVAILFIALRDCLYLSIGFSVFSGLTIIAALILDREGRFLYAFSLIPFSRGLPYSEMILIVLLVELVDSILVKKECKVTVKMYLPILGISAIEMLDYIKFNVNSIEIVYLVCYMVMATYAVDFQVFKGGEEKFVYGYSLGTIIAVLLVIIREINELGLEYIFTYNVRFGANTGERMVTNFNSNELGLYCVVSLCLLLALGYGHKKKLPFVMAVMVTAIGAVSISRTFIVLAVLSWVLYLVVSRKPIRGLVIVLVVFSVFFLSAKELIPDFMDWIQSYFISRSHTAGGRLNLMVDYFNWTFASFWTFFFGYSEAYPSILNSVASHNGIQEMFVCWGVFGGVLCLVWMFMLLQRANRNRHSAPFRWIPVFVFFVFIQTIQLFTMHGYLLVMVLAMTPLVCGRRLGVGQAAKRIDRLRFV